MKSNDQSNSGFVVFKGFPNSMFISFLLTPLNVLMYQSNVLRFLDRDDGNHGVMLGVEIVNV